MQADEVLRNLARAREVDLGRLLLEAFRAVNATVFEQLAERGHPAVRPSHAVVFMNLDPDGTKMVTLAQRAGITRQAMSKLIHDLQTSGYVEVQPDPDDGRATRVLLTGRGIAFCAEVGNVISELEQRWRQLLGVDRLGELRDALRTIGQATPPA